MFGTSSVIGPLSAACFAGHEPILGITGWRWVFLINVPIGLIALAIVMRVLHIPHTRHNHRIDWWGAAALIVGIVPLLWLPSRAGNGVGVRPRAGLIASGWSGVAAFIWVEFRMRDEALIPMRLFRSGVFSLGLGINVLVGMAMFGALSTLPLYLQLVKGATPTESGLMLIPMMIGIMSGSVISGQLTARTGRYKIFPVIGAAMLTIAFFLLLTVQVDSSSWLLDSLFLMIGLGLGLNMQTMLMAVQNAVPARDMGVATSSATFFRQLGGTLGVAVFISLLFNSLPGKMTSAVQASATDPAFQQALGAAGATTPQQAQELLATYGGKMQTNSSFLQQIDPALALPFKQGFVDSTHLVYIVAGIIMSIAFVMVLMLKEAPLRTMSALEERQLEDAALMGEDAETLQEQVDEDLAMATVGNEGTSKEAPAGPPSPVTHGRHGLDEVSGEPPHGPGKHTG